MLLIIFLGLIANLVLFCDGCNFGTSAVNNVNWNQAVGTWYVLLHTPNAFENNFKCVVATYGIPVRNIGSVTLEAYDISEQSTLTLYGNATYRTSNTFDEYFQQTTIWNGNYQVVATDYNSYIVLEMCSFEDNQLYNYVAYRSQQPDQGTVKEVKKVLRQRNINASQLVAWKTNNCQQG